MIIVAAVFGVITDRFRILPEAEVADLLILRAGDALYAVPREAARITPQKSNDPSQRHDDEDRRDDPLSGRKRREFLELNTDRRAPGVHLEADARQQIF